MKAINVELSMSVQLTERGGEVHVCAPGNVRIRMKDSNIPSIEDNQWRCGAALSEEAAQVLMQPINRYMEQFGKDLAEVAARQLRR